MLKKLFSHTAIYGLAPQVPKLVSILTLPIITAHLTEIDFGVFGLITAVVGGVSVFANLGLNVVLSNSFYKHPTRYEWLWRQIYGFLILWNIPYAVILGAVIYAFIPPEAKANTITVVLLNTIPIVFFGPTAVIGALYYQLKQRPFQIAIRSALTGLLTVLMNVYFIAFLEMGYLGWFLSACISQMLLQLSYWFPIQFKLNLKPIFNFKRRLIKRQLVISLPTVPHFYGGYLLNTSDRVVMRFFNVPTGDIGLFNAANTVGNVFMMLGTASGQAIAPMLMKSLNEQNEALLRKLVYSLQIIFLSLTFICSLWLREIFFILIKNQTLQKVYPLGILIVMAYNYRPMYFGANYRLMYNEKTKVLLKVTFVAGIGNLLLNMALIPFFGYKVAAYTTFVGLMYMGYSGYYLKEFKESCDVNYHPIKWLILTVLLTIIALVSVELMFMYKVFITISATLVVLIALRLVSKSYNNQHRG